MSRKNWNAGVLSIIRSVCTDQGKGNAGMKKILVTGGAGFVGSNLCRRLVQEENNDVICLDNLMTGKLDNIQDLIKRPNFKFIEHDVREAIDIDIHYIYHAACPASPSAYQKSPTGTLKTCVLGTLNMLELAKKRGAVLLQFSTSEVYGNPMVTPQPECYWGNVNPVGIRSCYDEGKRSAESLCFDYNREFGTRIKVIRIFNTYGPGMDPQDGRVVSNFITQALEGKDITIYGEGKQTRSFCYIDDLVEGIIRMMNGPENLIGPVNLGNPCEITVLKLARIILFYTYSKSKLKYSSLPIDDPTRRRPDITKAKNELGWEPKISLYDGLKNTIQFFQNYYDENGRF